MVSFIQKREDEKLRRYGEYKERRLSRGLKKISMKGYVNAVFREQFTRGRIPITFTEQDLEKIDIPHTDPLIIKLRIGDNLVSRVLIDGGSSSDIFSGTRSEGWG